MRVSCRGAHERRWPRVHRWVDARRWPERTSHIAEASVRVPPAGRRSGWEGSGQHQRPFGDNPLPKVVGGTRPVLVGLSPHHGAGKAQHGGPVREKVQEIPPSAHRPVRAVGTRLWPLRLAARAPYRAASGPLPRLPDVVCHPFLPCRRCSCPSPHDARSIVPDAPRAILFACDHTAIVREIRSSGPVRSLGLMCS